MKREKKQQTINRRKFVGNTVKIVTLGSLLMPIVEACGNKSSNKGNTGPGTGKGKGTNTSSKKSRKKWSHESLVMNTKTKVIHFPTSKVYTYYDPIKSNHLQEVSLAAWSSKLEEPVRFNKEQSGNIIEILTLRELGKDINRSEEHTSELQSPCNLVCRLLLEKKKKHTNMEC